MTGSASIATNPALAQKVNARAAVLNIPLSVLIECTRQCNLNCYYCYQKASSHTPDLPAGQWHTIFEGLKNLGTLYLTISGGEPFIRSDILEIVAAARSLDFAVSIISNGTLIDQKTAHHLASLQILDIGISLLAHNAEGHDRLSGLPGSFEAACSALTYCKNAGLHTMIKHTVSAANLDSLTRLRQFADDHGHHFETDPMVSPDTFGTPSPYALNAEQAQSFFNNLTPTREIAQATANDSWNLHCDAGRSLMGIRSDGTVLPCIMLPIPLGNAATAPIAEIWKNEKAERFRADEKLISPMCTSCTASRVCARCPGVAFAETGGRWQGPSPSLCIHGKAQHGLT